MSANKRSYASGHYELTIDGIRQSAYVKSYEGGTDEAAMSEQRHGSSWETLKNASVRKIEPYTFDIGMAAMGGILDWAKAVLERRESTKTGSICHADVNGKIQHEQWFFGAELKSIAFPELNANSSEASYAKVKVQAQSIEDRDPGNQKAQGDASEKMKLWVNSAFRFTIDGVPGMDRVNKIDAFTIEQNYSELYTGEEFYAAVVPNKAILFPDLTFYVSEAAAGQLLKWEKEYVRLAKIGDRSAEKNGSIEFLAPNRKDVLFAIQLLGMKVPKVKMQNSKANNNDVKRVQCTVSVNEMKISGKGLGIA